MAGARRQPDPEHLKRAAHSTAVCPPRPHTQKKHF